MAENDLLVSLDKLPIKRIDAIEESGLERFPPDLGYDEKTVNLIRRIDFTWAVERDAKKQKKKKTKAKESSGPSMWQGLIENLQLARQEVQVIIDLIATVEANDAVAVAGMNRPKPLPNEALSDLAVSTATKLQCYRHLGKYFKQSAKALEHQIAREARFYGALIRLQKNWKVKRHRLAANAPGSEGFLIDLSDNSMHESAVLTRPPAFSMVRVDHDSTGMLAVNIPKSSCRSFRFGFLDVQSGKHSEESEDMDFIGAKESPKETVKNSLSDDDRVRETNTVLCDAHRAIFYELVFELISRESFNPSLGFSVTGIRENYLELSLKPGVSAFISLEPYDTQDHARESKDAQDAEVSYGTSLMEIKREKKIESGRPNHTTYEIYLEQLFHNEIFSKGMPQPTLPGRAQPVVQTKDDEGLVTHFCLSLSHRIFSSKVLVELESLVTKVPYLQLITQPTWHSRTSSWTLYVKFPESILDARSQAGRSDDLQLKKSLFQTRVVVKDDCISIEGGGAPNVVGLFKGDLEAMSSKGRFNCDLVDLPMVLLLQVASQIISWLHEEASIVGIKTNLDFLSISWELDQVEALSLIAHVDPEDPLGCISWWLILDDNPTEDRKFPAELADGESSTRRFLGYLALDTLYSTLMDLVSVCTGSVNH